MQPFAVCPIAQVARPLEARGEPFSSPPVEPARLAVASEALEAPLRRSLVEPVPRPFHDDDRATARERADDPVDHVGWIGGVMEGGGGDDCVESPREPGAVGLAPPVI